MDFTHILFVKVDHSFLKSNIFGLIGFAKLLKNLFVQHIMIFLVIPKVSSSFYSGTEQKAEDVPQKA